MAIGLLCASNPILSVLDTLSKLSHDSDAEVAYAAIFAMGLVGAGALWCVVWCVVGEGVVVVEVDECGFFTLIIAPLTPRSPLSRPSGTNQARIAAMLRNLAQFYAKDANALFMVRVAQGLLHTGKGSITMCPSHTERSLVSPASLAGLLSTLTAVMDSQNGAHCVWCCVLCVVLGILSCVVCCVCRCSIDHHCTRPQPHHDSAAAGWALQPVPPRVGHVPAHPLHV